MPRPVWPVPLSAALAAVLLLTGCWWDGGEGGEGEAVVMGTTDPVRTLDPAAAYDPGSWLLIGNVFQSLLSLPPGGTEPQPEAADACGFTDRVSRRFTCRLRRDLTFSDGAALTSHDVRYSFERTLRIAAPHGPAALLSAVERIDTPDDRTVTFHLSRPDATFAQKIATPAGAIVDHRSYPAGSLRTDGGTDGSGVYTLESHDDATAVLAPNSRYQGPADLRNSGMTVRFYPGDPAALRDALTAGTVDLAHRGLTATDLAALRDEGRLTSVTGSGLETHFLVPDLGGPRTGDPAVRRALALLIDRDALVEDVLPDTAEPLQSLVPAGMLGHTTPFLDRYGDHPDPERAREELRGAGHTEPVRLTLCAPDGSDPDATAAADLIAAQLGTDGLFAVTVRALPAADLTDAAADGDCPLALRGWSPDYPDPDSFLQPLVGAGGILPTPYDAPHVTDDLVPATERATDRERAADGFAAVQEAVAEDLPLLPLWQDRQQAVAARGVTGLRWALDSATAFRFWEIAKDTDRR
ncbi:ABC transporter substrate-binding protein [Streptomyces avicenniae]|uniref:ABC transporter substrate-binding protein n=1 Tax=Streptomyces avicenniae TaxID=500153 RepID=UPI00069C11A9|nr:ABC transporter substrate-binding protein [Streptomyces avicenniae]